METRGWQSKGDKAPRRSPRRQRKTCGRPFKAPRKGKSSKTVPQVKASEAGLVLQDGQDTQDSQVQQISETENDRDIRERIEQDNEVGQDDHFPVRQDNQDSHVQEISATENDRDMQNRTEQESHIIPFIPGIRMMSEWQRDNRNVKAWRGVEMEQR
jgi:hypothetical protein